MILLLYILTFYQNFYYTHLCFLIFNRYTLRKYIFIIIYNSLKKKNVCVDALAFIVKLLFY